MRKTHSLIVAGAVALVLGGTIATSVATASPASREQPARHGRLFESNLVGRPADPSLTVTIRGVSPGAVPWALSMGTAGLEPDGRLQVELEGLVITGTNSALDGTTGQVKKVAASLTCEGAQPTVATTGAVPLSPRGDAQINEQLTLPALCLAPVVLVRANTATGPWIASTGF